MAWPRVDETLRLDSHFAHTAEPLDDTTVRAVFQQARRAVRARDPLLAHVLEFKLVRDGQSNYVNARVRKDLVHAVYTAREEDVLFVFVPSEKLEPVVVVVGLHAAVGKLSRLTREQVRGLERAVEGFERQFGVCATQFYYTPARERRGGGLLQQRPHSAHFHVKVGVSAEVHARLLPVTQAFGPGVLGDAEYLAYHRGRPALTRAELVRELLAEAGGAGAVPA